MPLRHQCIDFWEKCPECGMMWCEQCNPTHVEDHAQENEEAPCTDRNCEECYPDHTRRYDEDDDW